MPTIFVYFLLYKVYRINRVFIIFYGKLLKQQSKVLKVVVIVVEETQLFKTYMLKEGVERCYHFPVLSLRSSEETYIMSGK